MACRLPDCQSKNHHPKKESTPNTLHALVVYPAPPGGQVRWFPGTPSLSSAPACEDMYLAVYHHASARSRDSGTGTAATVVTGDLDRTAADVDLRLRD